MSSSQRPVTIAVVGGTGAGKTTIMRLLTGILEPTSGEAWVYNKHTVKEPESLKDNIAYMSQRFGLYEDLTVIENLNFYFMFNIFVQIKKIIYKYLVCHFIF